MAGKAQIERARLNNDVIISVRVPKEYYDKLIDIGMLRKTYMSSVARKMIVDAVNALMPKDET